MLRFVFVGGLAVAIDFVVYFSLLHSASFIPISVSKAISYVFGAIVSFVGHRKFVFSATDSHVRHQILPFVVLYFGSLVSNNIANHLILFLTQIKILAWFIAICTSTTINFLGLKLVVFKKELVS